MLFRLCHLANEVLDSQTTRAHVEGHHLGCVGIKQGVAGHVIHDVEEEETDDDSVACTGLAALCVDSGEGDEGHEDRDHANKG